MPIFSVLTLDKTLQSLLLMVHYKPVRQGLGHYDLITQGALLKKIFEIVFVNKSVELGIIDPHDKVIFDGCKVKSFCKRKYQPEKYCRCSSNSIKPFKCSMCTDPEATKGYDSNLDKYVMGYGLHFAATPLVVAHPNACLLLSLLQGLMSMIREYPRIF